MISPLIRVLLRGFVLFPQHIKHGQGFIDPQYLFLILAFTLRNLYSELTRDYNINYTTTGAHQLGTDIECRHIGNANRG